jgi:hypothetical protein
MNPAQILSRAYQNYERFNSEDNKSAFDNIIDFNSTNMDLNESKQKYINQENNQQQAVDILKKSTEITTDDDKKNTTNKESFEPNLNYKIEIDIKTIIIIVLIIVAIYLYTLYLNTKSKLKYIKKILKHNQ